MLELSQIFNNLVMNPSLGSISTYSTYDIQLTKHGSTCFPTFLSNRFFSLQSSLRLLLVRYSVIMFEGKRITSVNNCLLSTIKCCGLLVHVNIKLESSISLFITSDGSNSPTVSQRCENLRSYILLCRD